jgi:hypothetical protein
MFQIKWSVALIELFQLEWEGDRGFAARSGLFAVNRTGIAGHEMPLLKSITSLQSIRVST